MAPLLPRGMEYELKMRSSSLALAVALPAPAPSFAQDADDIGQGCERKVKKAKRLIGRSVVHGQIAVPEGFRYIFGAIATTGDRRTAAVMGWVRILAHLTRTVDQEVLARNEYLATVREHRSAFQYLSCGIYRTPGTHRTLTRRQAGGRRREGALPSPNSLSTASTPLA
jgi:hypothetical protein